MIERLRRQLASPELLKRLEKLAADAPVAAPLSLRIELGKFDTDWLHLLPDYCTFWFRARPGEQEFRLGIGQALHVSSAGRNRFAALDNAFAGFCQQWRSEAQALAFAGFAFDPCNNTPLPNALLSIPAILLENIKGCCSATLSTPAGRIQQAKADWLQYLGSPLATPSPVELLPSRLETLPARAWIARVNAALRDINLGQVDKLVLSRSRKFNASRSFLPAEILKRLIEQQQDSLIYAHGNGQQTFLGATPERLVSLHGDQISADVWPVLPGQAQQNSPDRRICTNNHWWSEPSAQR